MQLKLYHMMNINWTYWDDHLAIYTSTESLHCEPETNVASVIPQFFKKVTP